MAKPTRDITWATDTNYAAGTDGWSGNATKVVPSVGQRATGWVPERPMAAQLLNEQISAVAEHLDYVHGVIEGTVDTDGLARVMEIPAKMFTPHFDAAGVAQWDTSSAGAASRVFSADTLLDLRGIIPHGSRMTSIDALMQPGTGRAATFRMDLRLEEEVTDWVTPAASGGILVANQEDAGGTALQVVTLAALNHDIDHAKSTYLRIRSGASPFVSDTFVSVRINYTDFRAVR